MCRCRNACCVLSELPATAAHSCSGSKQTDGPMLYVCVCILQNFNKTEGKTTDNKSGDTIGGADRLGGGGGWAQVCNTKQELNKISCILLCLTCNLICAHVQDMSSKTEQCLS